MQLVAAETQAHRVLVIDDNPDIHDDFRKILVAETGDDQLDDLEAAFFGDATPHQRATSIQLDSAHQGQEGVAMVKAALEAGQPYSVAFVDMRMPPGWDGLTTIEHLWEVDPSLLVVICTAYSDHTWSDIIDRLGQTDRLLILKKPFDNVEVSQLAVALIEKWKLSRQVAFRMDEMEKSIVEQYRRVEAAHRQTENLLSAISSILIGIDETGTVNRWNDAASELFGISADTAIGQIFLKLPIAWSDPETAEEFFRETNVDSLARQVVQLERDGDTRIVGLSRYPVLDNGQAKGALYLGTDITQHKRMEQQLHQAQKLESVGQLAAGVAHEINTPLQYIGDNLDYVQNKLQKLEGLTELLSQLHQCQDDEARELELVSQINEQLGKLKISKFLSQVTDAINDSQDGVSHVSRIVRAMKEFAHPGVDEKTPVDINRTLDSSIVVSTNEWKYVADIETDYDDSLMPVPALAGELSQVFLNLLVNAAHAIGDATDGGAEGKGKIVVRTRNLGSQVEIQIEDSGCGIPDEIRHRIFDPFFTTKAIGKGTGQGLSIAYSVVVQKHGGKLWCDSQPGVGTTFFIQLPTEDGSEADGSDE